MLVSGVCMVSQVFHLVGCPHDPVAVGTDGLTGVLCSACHPGKIESLTGTSVRYVPNVACIKSLLVGRVFAPGLIP